MTVVETVTSPQRPNQSEKVHRLLLVYGLEAGQVGRSVFIDAEPVVLGRAIDAHGLQVSDPEVSRTHAELRLDGEEVVLCDRESRNGTLLNGVRVAGTSALADGDVIRVGSHVLLYQCLDEVDCRHLLDPVPSGTPLIGTSPAMARVRHSIRLAGPGALSTLIIGETGVGKELVAHAIHVESGRTGQFVALNCGALPEALAESELFGHVGGAFTGAHQRQGLFSRARGGTLFLDEIGEMDLPLQKRLLRALSTGEVRAVGSDHTQHIDVRVVSATNVDLEAAVQEGTFRGDLYARLAGHVVSVPPLRRRKEDIIGLLQHFLRARKVQAVLTADAAEALLIHGWPFNVRELEHAAGVLEPLLRTTKRLSLEHLPEKIAAVLGDRKPAPSAPSRAPVSVLGIRRDVPPSKEELTMLLELYRGNVSQVAAFFGKGRRQVYRWAKAHGVDVGALREDAKGDGDDADDADDAD